jgi:hypothetical protein
MSSIDGDDEEFPYSSLDLTPALPAPESSKPAPTEGEFSVEDYKTALRLLVGSALEGNDELRYRIKIWRDSVQKEQAEKAMVLEPEEPAGSALLYAFLGILFKTPDYLNRGASSTSQITSRATSLVAALIRPVKNSWFLKPARRRYHGLVARGESVVTSLEDIGRAEARASRTLIRRQVSDETIEELLSYVVEKAKIKELIAEQGAEVTEDVVTEMRVRSEQVDGSLDKIIDNILRRQKRDLPPSSSSSSQL